jgi:hypothetical protein
MPLAPTVEFYGAARTMRRLTSRLALIVLVATTASTANAVVILNFDQQTSLPFFTQRVPNGFSGVPGQTMSVVAPPQLTFPPPSSVVDCAQLVGDCTQSLGGIVYSTTTAIPGTAGAVVGSGSVGADAVSAVAHVTCAAPCVTAVATQVAATDYQHFMVTLGGPVLPEFVDIDLTYTLASLFADNSAVAPTSPYSASAISSLWVGEASTYNAAAGAGVGSIFVPFLAEVIAGRDTLGNVTASESLVGDTQTIHVRPNTDYWVGMTGASVTFFFAFNPGPGAPPHDYTGLDLSFSSFADPTFALNAAWAAANPAFAADLVIDRQFNGMPVSVPEPATALLLATALGLLLLARTRLSRQPWKLRRGTQCLRLAMLQRAELGAST